MLSFNSFKAYLLVPILSLLTVFILPLRLYWSADLRSKYLYSQVNSLNDADHILVRGKDGNIEIVKLQDLTD